MTTGTAILIAVISALLGLIVGAVLGVLFNSRRAQNTGENSARLREQLASASSRATLLEQQLNQEADRARNEQKVLHTLAPLAQQLNQLGRQVNQLEQDRGQQYGRLSQQLRTAAETDTALLSNTQSLLETLRSTSARGHWGEVQLRRVVEAAGMVDHVDFTEQFASSNDSGEKIRPDMVVQLPGDKLLAVDAKAPLSAILQAGDMVDDGSEEIVQRREALYRQHAKDVRQHVRALAKKQYWTGLENSPEMVMCFLPGESYLATALQTDPELLDDAFSSGVALVSPVSLLAALKSVAYSWQQENLVDNAREVFQSAHELYKRVRIMNDHLIKVGGSLKNTVEAYNSFIRSVEKRFLPSARRIQQLDGSLKPITENSAVEVQPLVATQDELTN